MRIEPEISGVAIVMIGHFNPQIFQPFWLAHHDVISEESAESANVGFVHPEITSFKLDGDFTVQVQRERFSIDRAVAPLIRIADVASRIFGDLLPHTPISQVGINRLLHFDVGSESTRDQIGFKLAPQEPWGEWGKLLSHGEGLKHGGMSSLTMIQRDVPGRAAGWIQTKVEPSNVLNRGRTGIYVEINDHYDLGKTPDGADEIVEIIRTKFDDSIANSDAIIDQIMSLKP